VRGHWVALGLLAALGLAAGGDAPRRPDPPVYPAASQPVEPATPPNPFGPPNFSRPDAVPGYIELDNGDLAVGRIYTTRDKRLMLFDRAAKRFLPIPLQSLKCITGHLEWAREEPEWRWKEEGSDDKLYSGRSYPVMKVYYTFALLDGREFTGDCQTQPLYVAAEKEEARYILWQRHKGAIGQTVPDLRYIKSAQFGDQAQQRGRDLLKERPQQGEHLPKAEVELPEHPPERPPILIGDPVNKVVHRHTCRFSLKISDPPAAGFLTLGDATAAGYAACDECRPGAATAPATRPAGPR
jgi:hypothetical protein